MICVREQTDGPCMFLLTLVQILGQIKDATWLLQTECSSDQAYFSFLLLLPSNLFLCFHLSLPLSRKYRPFTFSFPHFHQVLLQSFFLFKWIHGHPFFFLTLPAVSHIPITLSPHVRKTWVCVVSAQLWEQSSSGSIGPVVGSACVEGRGPL